MPLPDISNNPDLAYWERPVPLWLKLDEYTKKKLRKYQWRHYQTELNPPTRGADIADFDPAREMRQAPGSEEHMKR